MYTFAKASKIHNWKIAELSSARNIHLRNIILFKEQLVKQTLIPNFELCTTELDENKENLSRF